MPRHIDGADPAPVPPADPARSKRYLYYIAGDVRRVAGNARQMLSLARATERLGHSVTFVAQAWGPQSEFRAVDAPLDSEGKDAHRLQPPFDITWLDPDAAARRWLAFLFRAYQFRPLRPVIRRLYIAALRPVFNRILDAARAQVVVTCSCNLIYFNEALEQSARDHAALFAIVPMCHIETGENTGPRFISLFKRAGAVLASTGHEAAWLRAQKVPASKTYVLGASADYVVAELAEAGAKSEADAEARPRQVLFLGRKVRSKGYHLILGAMAAVWAEFPETQFVFVGPGESEWRDDIAGYQHDARVLDIGAVDEERVAWLKRCAMLCVPSVAESFGLIYTEAWLFHKPVIAADIAVTRETVGQTEGGLIVEPTVEEVAAAVLQLLRNPAQARDMGERGWRATQDKYSWAKIARALDGIADEAHRT